MVSTVSRFLHRQQFSLDHGAWINLLATTQNLLIVQDLDGVCMGLVNDPLDRVIELAYVSATQAFDGHFYVLTNGEHTGQRGINGIIERAAGGGVEPSYLPGLAAGGVQWQTRAGDVSHPGVSEAELAFLAAVPDKIRQCLQEFFDQHSTAIAGADLQRGISASALDNIASPTANLNTLHGLLQGHQTLYVALQHAVHALMEDLLREAAAQGLG
ncbi:MAG: glucosylglycerol 3-phosphatase, partial [Nodosilinea sp.]